MLVSSDSKECVSGCKPDEFEDKTGVPMCKKCDSSKKCFKCTSLTKCTECLTKPDSAEKYIMSRDNDECLESCPD